MRQLLTVFDTNTPAGWRADDIDLAVERGARMPVRLDDVPASASLRFLPYTGGSGLAAAVQDLIDLGQRSCEPFGLASDFRSTAVCRNRKTSPMPLFGGDAMDPSGAALERCGRVLR